VSLNNTYNPNLERIYQCIEYFLGLNVRDVPIKYLNLIEFYQTIKSNTKLPKELYNDPDFIKEFFRNACDITQGMYKWKEKMVIIKEIHKHDSSMLLTELIHSKSITQNFKEIEDWIKEGIPHYIAKILSEKCKIPYIKSEREKFFVIWDDIYKRYNLELLKTLIYPEDIQITKKLLKQLLNYNKDDILTISFERAKHLLNK